MRGRYVGSLWSRDVASKPEGVWLSEGAADLAGMGTYILLKKGGTSTAEALLALPSILFCPIDSVVHLQK